MTIKYDGDALMPYELRERIEEELAHGLSEMDLELSIEEVK